MDSSEPTPVDESEGPEDRARGESRWPSLIVLGVAMTLPFLMPDHFLPTPPWVSSTIEGCFLVAMIMSDPGRIDRRSMNAHRVRIGLVIVLVTTSARAAASLTDDLIQSNSPTTDDGTSLLQAGGVVWLALVISFTFLYWELDLGGPGERAHRERKYPDMAFPQELSPEICKPGWRPVFVDYLYIGVTNGLAFSPTDVMPTAHWAKLAMGVHSVSSLLIIGLVIARAVNVLQ
jgi:uncharacterized membrane protein